MKQKAIFTLFLFIIFKIVGIAQLDEVNAPIKNFEQLWKIFEQRYANFELKQIDWHQTYKQYRPLINRKTTNKELFDICCLMVQELKDGHVTIEPNFKEIELECGPPYPFSLDVAFDSEDKWRQFESISHSTLIKNGFSEPIKKNISAETNFQYRLSDSFGYLRMDEMTEKITFGKLNSALKESLEAFQQKQGLIIDLRFNGGGWDYISYKLASRFLPKGTTIGHFERTRIKGRDDYTPMKYKKVRSKGKYPFTQPIVILTSDFTASAAEVFLLLMQELAHVTIIGDNTEGIFSDMYEFKLPNKWVVSLSHQQYFSEHKENFEGKGIPPAIRVVNSQLDIENGSDPVIEAAVNHLKGVSKH